MLIQAKPRVIRLPLSHTNMTLGRGFETGRRWSQFRAAGGEFVGMIRNRSGGASMLERAIMALKLGFLG